METILIVQIGDVLKHARMRQYPRVSQADAANLLGVHRVTYTNYERETQPIPDAHLIRLASVIRPILHILSVQSVTVASDKERNAPIVV